MAIPTMKEIIRSLEEQYHLIELEDAKIKAINLMKKRYDMNAKNVHKLLVSTFNKELLDLHYGICEALDAITPESRQAYVQFVIITAIMNKILRGKRLHKLTMKAIGIPSLALVNVIYNIKVGNL